MPASPTSTKTGASSVRLMPAHYVKAYIKRNKHDAADAEAICEAVGRTIMRFVPAKTAAEQASQLLHRGREQLAHQRTMLVKALRALFAQIFKCYVLCACHPSISFCRQIFPAAMPPRISSTGFCSASIKAPPSCHGIDNQMSRHRGDGEDEMKR